MQTLKLIERIFAQPTAPFCEKFVLQEIKTILKENKIPFFEDSVGQIIAGSPSTSHLKKQKRLIAFVAHTDHPGFHITEKVKKNHYKAMWLGGAPFTQMEGKNVRVFSYDSSTKFIKGKIKNLEVGGNHRAGINFEILTTKEIKTPKSFGAFDFNGFKLKKDFVVTKCADDLAGCVMALGALLDTKGKNCIAIFTRAEEVGFVGCLKLIESKIIPKNTLMMSLEASRTLPGALLGEGPVIRLGDASTLFHSNMSLFVQKMAQNLKAKDAKFMFQKRIMDGGSCEATALSQAGFTTMGLAVPLKNYHNQGKNGPAPEIIHLNDAENGRKLLTELAKNLDKFPMISLELNKRLNDNYKKMKKYLNLSV
jgi:endoglucanase